MEDDKLSITVDEAAKMLGVGRNMMLKIVTVDGFPAYRFKRKILINKKKLIEWFDANAGVYGNY